MNSEELLHDVNQSFHKLNTKYSDIEPYLQKCLEEIKEKFTGEKAPTSKPAMEVKKEKLKTLLTGSIDLENIYVNYDELTSQPPYSVVELMDLLKKLNQAGASSKKKATAFAARQGTLLKNAKEKLSRNKFKEVHESCGFKKRYVYFLILLSSLFEMYPKLQYCAVPIRTFMANLPIIKKICEEDRTLWSNIY